MNKKSPTVVFLPHKIREKELTKFCPIVYTEIKEGGKGEKIKEIIKEHPDFLDFALKSGSMHDAAKHDNVDVLKVFLDAGISPDSIRGDSFWGFTLLWDAINSGAYNAVTCLLDAGADVNSNLSNPLISATTKGDIRMVKMLVERGADIHYTYIHRDSKERYNALKWAVIEDFQEIADYLRSLGAVMIEDEERPPQNPSEELLADLTSYFGRKPLKFGLGEIVSASVPLTVHIFPHMEHENTIFVTCGLSEYALPIPDDKELYCFAEYFIEMPGAWPVKDKDLEQEKYFWPIRWLKAIARYPHEKKTYYGDKTTVDTKMIPSLTMPDGKCSSALVERCEDLTLRVSQDGRLVIYYRITPLVPSALVHRLSGVPVQEICDPLQPSQSEAKAGANEK